jgi:hypothetical protein
MPEFRHGDDKHGLLTVLATGFIMLPMLPTFGRPMLPNGRLAPGPIFPVPGPAPPKFGINDRSISLLFVLCGLTGEKIYFKFDKFKIFEVQRLQNGIENTENGRISVGMF